jgi:hypothetical protein
MDVVELEQIIDRTGANWRAGENHISARGLTPGTNAFLGVVISESDRLAEMASASVTETFQAAAPPPRKIDWRNNNVAPGGGGRSRERKASISISDDRSRQDGITNCRTVDLVPEGSAILSAD